MKIALVYFEENLSKKRSHHKVKSQTIKNLAIFL